MPGCTSFYIYFLMTKQIYIKISCQKNSVFYIWISEILRQDIIKVNNEITN